MTSVEAFIPRSFGTAYRTSNRPAALAIAAQASNAVRPDSSRTLRLRQPRRVIIVRGQRNLALTISDAAFDCRKLRLHATTDAVLKTSQPRARATGHAATRVGQDQIVVAGQQFESAIAAAVSRAQGLWKRPSLFECSQHSEVRSQSIFAIRRIGLGGVAMGQRLRCCQGLRPDVISTRIINAPSSICDWAVGTILQRQAFAGTASSRAKKAIKASPNVRTG